MSAPTLQSFQDQVSELLLRHRSLLDVLSKYGQTNASVNRSVVKAVTECGCIELNAKKQFYAEDVDMEQAKQDLKSHLSGELCEHCKEIVTAELGKNLFYMSALCNLLEISMDDVVANESSKCSTLGYFNLS
ncbi:MULTISPECIES: DUF1573 domain-containing protein [unclassified Paenibacillus]|uniref:DUF1573 domain-containing protein n=1 Tax=unclassified Paenibacillus TaxID=185978 RepID=UPI001C116971|nr:MULTISPECIES: DUF1573 domain-containing protein [unclassified Paenibacillus]MBU5443729.1 DUF1573 domain-containing protein [Paenibacillus sp. MSJ-34]CAH0120768.1 hypothetical protein PAE9249_03290 [Paenibacillus sp. CECT 9249]